MSKKIEDYLHLYLGCECIWESSDGNEGGNTELDLHTLMMQQDFKYKVKPLLRPLSSMTEEELIEVIQVTVPDNFEDKPDNEDYDMEMFYNDGGNNADADVAVGANVSCICYEGQVVIRNCGSVHFFDESGEPEQMYNMPKVFLYLLSKHFDLFGLIDAGLAIDKTKI